MNVIHIGTWEPELCGIATYGGRLVRGVQKIDSEITHQVIAVNGDREVGDYPNIVEYSFHKNSQTAYEEATRFLNSKADVVNLQHENGIFGGPDGEYVLNLTEKLSVPLATTFHTVKPGEERNRKMILEELTRRSDICIVLSKKSGKILRREYDVPEEKIRTIHHGVFDFKGIKNKSVARRHLNLGLEDIILCTPGHLRRPKGYEYGIQAMPFILNELNGRVKRKIIYESIGHTHPGEMDGNKDPYREELECLVKELRVEDYVTLRNRHLTDFELKDCLIASDILVLPYQEKNQAASGFVGECPASGTPTISTPFIYAKEIAKDAGIYLLKEFQDPKEIADSIVYLLENPQVMADMSIEGMDFGKKNSWSRVARKYEDAWKYAFAKYSK